MPPSSATRFTKKNEYDWLRPKRALRQNGILKSASSRKKGKRSYFVLSWKQPTSSRILSHLNLSCLVLSYPILSYLILSYPIVSYRIVSYPVFLSYLFYLVLAWIGLTYLISSHLISSHLISSHRIASHLILSCLFEMTKVNLKYNVLRSKLHAFAFSINFSLGIRNNSCSIHIMDPDP